MLQQYTDLEVRVREFCAKIAKRQEGATAVEYGLMVALIAVVIIAGVSLLGTEMDTKFSEVATEISGAGS